jgi:hypothetical protein
MLEDEKEFREELAKEDKKNEEDRIKAQEKLYEEHRKQIQKIEDDLTDALMRAFESGKGFGQAFKDTLINMFRTMVLRPILAPITGAFAGAFGGGGAMAAGAGAGGMGAGSGFLGGLGAASSAFGSYLATGFMNTIAGTGFTASLTAAGTMIGTGAMSGIVSGLGMAAGALLPVVGAIALIPSISKALFGGGRRTTATGITGTFTTGGANVMGFEDWRRSGGLLRRGSSGTNYSPIAGETQMFLDESLIAITQATRSYAGLLGLNADAILDYRLASLQRVGGQQITSGSLSPLDLLLRPSVFFRPIKGAGVHMVEFVVGYELGLLDMDQSDAALGISSKHHAWTAGVRMMLNQPSTNSKRAK